MNRGLVKVGGYHQSNIGRVLEVYLIRKEQVLAVADPERYCHPGGESFQVPVGGVVTTTDAAVYQLIMPPGACSFEENRGQSDGGPVWAVSLSWQVPGVRKDVFSLFASRPEQQWVVLFKDANQVCRIAGNEEYGLRASMGHAIGMENAQAYTLSGNFNLPAFYLPTLNLEALFPSGQFSIDFNLNFNV